MRKSYLDYAMSVIVSRALPDVRDGLKPVHRRILWGMFDQGFRPDRNFVKCARVSGDVAARFHPHGTSAIYDALARMAQPFSLRHPLIAFHGNYGSPEDPPAADRYTECRLSPLAMQMLADIDEDTVDFADNYSAEFQEPTVLPARFPNLLVNGVQGIAVGMATNIPPHNLDEVCAAVVHLLRNPGAVFSCDDATRWWWSIGIGGFRRWRYLRLLQDGLTKHAPFPLVLDRDEHFLAVLSTNWRCRRSIATLLVADRVRRPAWDSLNTALRLGAPGPCAGDPGLCRHIAAEELPARGEGQPRVGESKMPMPDG